MAKATAIAAVGSVLLSGCAGGESAPTAPATDTITTCTPQPDNDQAKCYDKSGMTVLGDKAFNNARELDANAHQGVVVSDAKLNIVTAFEGVVASACGKNADESSAFYCSTDDTIYVGDMLLWSSYQTSGEAFAEAVVAHEYTHSIQDGEYEGLATIPPVTVENQADCGAGAYFRQEKDQGVFTQQDSDKMAAGFYAIGDIRPVNERDHGTPEDRQDWFNQGATHGLSGCVIGDHDLTGVISSRDQEAYDHLAK